MNKDINNKDVEENVPQEPATGVDLEAQLEEMENNWKRALADYQNLQRRSAEDRIGFVQYANTNLIRKLLPTVDNLEKISEHFEDESLKMVLKDIRQLLTEEGVEEIETKNMMFDAMTMEAIEMVPGEQGKVIDVVQKGYKLKDRLIRPAKVNVGLGGSQ